MSVQCASNTENQLLIACLRQAITGKPVQLPQEINWQSFAKLVKLQQVTPFVYSVLEKNSVQMPENIRKWMEGTYNRAIYRDIQFDYVRQQITQRLNGHKIPHIFLKGICLKHAYPIPALRTMSDMDILVHAQDFPVIRKEMESMGATFEEGDGNHRSYSFANGVRVEFHPNLIHCSSAVGTKINPGWQYAKPMPAEGEMELTPEGFYLFTICHMADHFVTEGTTARFVTDIWVCQHLSKSKMDRSVVENELEKIGLLEYAKQIEALAEVWFGDGIRTAQLQELEQYILETGQPTQDGRVMLNAVTLSSGQNRISALLAKVFYPRQDLENRYDWVIGRPWLLPVAWVVRVWKAVTNRGALINKWRKTTKQYSSTEIMEQKKKLERFGIK